MLMALFREHISFGAIVAMAGVVLSYYYAYVTDGRLLIALFIVTVVASFLPDLDSDSGTPFTILISLLTLIVTGATLYIALLFDDVSPWVLFGVPLGAGFFVWAVIGWIFKKSTKHRGMYHSIPAMCIVGVATYIISRAILTDDYGALVLGIGAAVGYLTHLVLDEIHASVTIDGGRFRSRRSLGTALKFFSPSKTATIFTYTLLATLLMVAV